MNKQHIIDEIRRTTTENGGVPLGHKRFEQQTGIPHRAWWGKHWGRWGDALREAGFDPNSLQGAFSDDAIMQKLIALIRELGRFPGNGDFRLKKRSDPTFPNEKVFDTHFGARAQIRRAVVDYCAKHPGLDDIPALCCAVADKADSNEKTETNASWVIAVFVYLMRSGKHYKIGKTNATGRREYELAIQLPEKLRTVHVIKTDDPDGIEAYWHKRFASKRANGEWFALDAQDVNAFRLRKFM